MVTENCESFPKKLTHTPTLEKVYNNNHNCLPTDVTLPLHYFPSHCFPFHQQSNLTSINSNNINDIESTCTSSHSNNNITKCMLVNVRSLNNKVYQLTELLLEQSVDVCCVTETWFRGANEPAMVELRQEGYDVISVPRKNNKKGGGVAFLCQAKTYNIKKIKTTDYECFELLEVILLGKTDILRYSIIYRTGYLNKYDKNQFLQELNLYIESLIDKDGINIILGDFNIRHDKNDSLLYVDFLDTMESVGFKQIIQQPTHIDGGVLDLIFLPVSFSVTNLQVLNDQAISDHFPIIFDIPLVPSKLPTHFQRKYRDMSKLNLQLFKSNIKAQIKNIINGNVENERHLNNSLVVLDQCLLAEMNNQAPLITKLCKITNKVVRNNEIQKARTLKRRAERKFRKSKSEVDRISVKRARKDLITIVKSSRNQFFKDKLLQHKNDVRKTYNIINLLLDKNKDKILPSHVNEKTLANQFATFYKEKIDNIRSSLNPSANTPLISSTSNNMSTNAELTEFMPISKEKLLTIIQKLDSNKQTVLDPIPCKLLKDCKAELLPVLQKIINHSFRLGYFPDHLKHAVVTPVIKSTNLDTEQYNNYRPVSSLKLDSKMFEASALEQLTDHLDNNNLHCKYQSAYRKGHSCETALAKIYNDAIDYLSPTTYVLLVFLDFSAAFDTIDHSILINRLNSDYGIKGKALAWLDSYLRHRTYKVKINNTISDPMPLTHGVPQGSTLGPLLFSLYTKKLSEIAHSYQIDIHFYADDTQLYMQCDQNTDFKKLVNCLISINTWSTNNYLKLNNNKTKFLAVSTTKYKFQKIKQLDVMGETFTVDNTVKNLGFMLDENLSMAKQINRVCSTGYGMLRNLWKISRKVTDRDIRTQLIHSSILSRVDYCNSLYTFLPGTETKKLQKLINASVRFIFNISGFKRIHHITPYLKELHFLPIEYRSKFKISLMVYKYFHNNSPAYLTELLIRKQPQTNWNLRINLDTLLLDHKPLNRNKLQNYRNRSFSYAAPTIWNVLPLHVRKSSSIDIFKSNLKNYYFNLWNDKKNV